jgi:hypothetical protein
MADELANTDTNPVDPASSKERAKGGSKPAVKGRDRKRDFAKQTKRARTGRPFPAASFEDSLVIANAMQQLGGDLRVRRITIFEHLKKSPESGPSRQLITNSSAYGITTGSYKADYIELTPDGALATGSEVAAGDKFKSRLKLGIERIEPFRLLYEKYAGAKLPAIAVLRDFLREAKVEDEWLEECISLFIVNCKFVGVLREVAGAERLLQRDHALEEALKGKNDNPTITITPHVSIAPANGWAKKCFYITPIGKEGSEERKHADLFMACLIQPAIEPLGLEVIRADQIGDPGMIATHVIQHLRHCGLAIADMSHRNPNVFYEMALRHAAKLPLVQLIRKSDDLPFDINQVRSVVVDTTDIYSLVPKLQVYISEIQTQARRALEDPSAVGNPITVFYPEFFTAD